MLRLAFAVLHLSAAAGECFLTTKEVMEAQIADVIAETTNTYKEYEICEGTKINVGFPNQDFSDFSNGDFPLAIIRPNAMIKCSGCEINGGFVQFAAIPNLAPVISPQPLLGIRVDNTTIKGVTFTGEIADLIPGIQGASGFISAPGTVRFEDCTWKHFAGPGVINIGVNVLTPQLEPGTVHVDIQGCTFSNITYGDYLMVCGDAESMTVSESTFVEIDYDATKCGCVEQTNFFLFECKQGSTCKFEGNCVSDTNFDAALLGQLDTSQFDSVAGNNFKNVLPKNETDAICIEPGVYSETDNACEDIEIADDFCGFVTTDPPEEGTDPPGESGVFKPSASIVPIAFIFNLVMVLF